MKMTKESLLKVIGAADDVISALAGTNDEVHKDDTDKMVRLWDDLNEQYAPPEVVRELARLALATMDSEPVAWTLHYREQWHVTNDERRAEFVAKDGDVAVLPLYRHAQPAPERDQVRQEHAEWSQATFGDVGPVGPLKHLSKEALEAAAEPGDLSEWADMQFLLWDAQRRAGITDAQITQAMIDKLAVNKRREWPEPKDEEPRLHINKQSALVLPEEITLEKVAEMTAARGAEYSIRDGIIAAKWWNACRAAMLQAGTLTNEGTIQAVNSPVIRDGYVLVPKEMTAEIGEAISMRARCCGGIALDIYDAMLAAASQEVK